ncbi:hypothetical protein M2345_002055 [Sphingobium sp. B8D3D]|nr:hypothetical protein [Sphingobium sp. B8D3D]
MYQQVRRPNEIMYWFNHAHSPYSWPYAMRPRIETLTRPTALLLQPGDLALPARPEWRSFAQSWDELPRDMWMADGGTYRRRRYAAFEVDGDACGRLPHRAHYQDRNHNPLNGGVERWFAPMADGQATSALLRDLMRNTAARISQASGCEEHAWMVEAHQFRIEALPDLPGLPTPEGMHQDGRDWVLILLVGGSNYSGGTTRVETVSGACLLEHRLAHAGEALLLDDGEVRHGTTPIQSEVGDLPAWRDTLVLTFANAAGR